MGNFLRRDRGAVAGLLVVVLLAAAVSVGVDHRRGGGPVLPGARAAARVLADRSGAGGGAGPTAAAIAELVTGQAGGFAGGSGSRELASGPAPASDGGSPNVPDEAPVVPEPPPVQLPTVPVPEQIRPLTQLAAPLGAQACQYLGLLPLAAALGGALGGAAPVSLADLLPYMRPLFDACLVIGVPYTETRCQVDNQIDDGTDVPPIPAALGLTVGEVIQAIPLPTPMGVLIDEMVAFERLALGPPKPGEAPRFSDRLLAALDCSQR
jgi:hypothetical protein